MIKKDINGITFYCFDTNEKEQQKTFEHAMIGSDAIRQMVSALVQAIGEAQVNERNVWIFIRQLLPEKYHDEDKYELEYNWIIKGFKIKSKN